MLGKNLGFYFAYLCFCFWTFKLLKKFIILFSIVGWFSFTLKLGLAISCNKTFSVSYSIHAEKKCDLKKVLLKKKIQSIFTKKHLIWQTLLKRKRTDHFFIGFTCIKYNFKFSIVSFSIVAVAIFIAFSYFADLCWVHRLIWSQWPPNWCSSASLLVLDHRRTHDPCVHRIWHIAPPFVYGLDFWESIINWCLIVCFDVFFVWLNCF